MTAPLGSPPVQPSRGRIARPRLRFLVLLAALFAVAGGALGVIYGSTQDRVRAGQAVLSLAPSNRIFGDETGDDDRTYTAFVQSELIVLNGRSVRSDVGRALGDGTPPAYSASQVGTTTIVRIDAQGASSAEVTRILTAAIEVYSDEREARLRREIQRTTAALDAELDRIQASLDEGVTGAGALQNEYGRLLGQRSGLARALANVDTAVTVVQPPTATGTGVPAAQRLGALGLFLGGLAGLGLAVLQRRLSRRVDRIDDIAATGLVPLYPELPRHHGLAGLLSADGDAGSAFRLVAGQVVPAGPSTAVVLFATSRGAGTSTTAAALSAFVAERDEVLLVLCADLVDPDGSIVQQLGLDNALMGLTDLPQRPLTSSDVEAVVVRTSVPGVRVLTHGRGAGGAHRLQRLVGNGLLEACVATGRTVLVDAPAMNRSLIAVEMLARAGRGILVAGRGVTTTSELELASAVVEAQGLVLAGTVFTEPGGRSPREGWPPPDDVSGEEHLDEIPGVTPVPAGAPSPMQHAASAPWAAEPDAVARPAEPAPWPGHDAPELLTTASSAAPTLPGGEAVDGTTAAWADDPFALPRHGAEPGPAVSARATGALRRSAASPVMPATAPQVGDPVARHADPLLDDLLGEIDEPSRPLGAGVRGPSTPGAPDDGTGTDDTPDDATSAQSSVQSSVQAPLGWPAEPPRTDVDTASQPGWPHVSWRTGT
jgi:hypothetical protein